MRDVGVIILGAGASSRMGRPKLLLPWGNTSVIGHLIGQWQSLGASQIAVVCRPDDSRLDAELDRLAFPSQNRIENPQPERGMFSSVLCAANWTRWKKEISKWAVVLGDQPHLRMETLRLLLECSTQNPDAICQPEFGGHAGHPVLLPRRAFAGLKTTRTQTLEDFLKQTSCPLVKRSIGDPGLALDLDTPEDYKQADITKAAHEKY
jgi:molybdenum cofactor cytidylyltransferase